MSRKHEDKRVWAYFPAAPDNWTEGWCKCWRGWQSFVMDANLFKRHNLTFICHFPSGLYLWHYLNHSLTLALCKWVQTGGGRLGKGPVLNKPIMTVNFWLVWIVLYLNQFLCPRYTCKVRSVIRLETFLHFHIQSLNSHGSTMTVEDQYAPKKHAAAVGLWVERGRAAWLQIK